MQATFYQPRKEERIPIIENPGALTIVVLAKTVSIIDDSIRVVYDEIDQSIIHKDVKAQINGFSRDVSEITEQLLTVYYNHSASQMERIQETFHQVNKSYEINYGANLMCSINLKIHSTIFDLKAILDLYTKKKPVDSRIINFHTNLLLHLEKFSKRGFWKKYHALDTEFETKLETLSKMY